MVFIKYFIYLWQIVVNNWENIYLLGCNDNPTAQQFMSAYRKLLLHNEVVSGKGANCLNDITNVLYVLSNIDTSKVTNKTELELLSNFDLENLDNEDNHLIEHSATSLKPHSLAYMASILETAVLRKISEKGKSSCSACMQIFVENEITDDSFIEYKSEISDILPPCKSTIELMKTVDNLLNKYKSQSVSFSSMLTHIAQNIAQNIDNKDNLHLTNIITRKSSSSL